MATKRHKKHKGSPIPGLRAFCASLRQSKATEPSHLKTGKWGEKQAVRFLKSSHWKILGERVRVGRHDEIDIIAHDGAALVFVEVKTRRDETFGRPISAVNREKQRRLSRAAVAWLKKNRPEPEFFRFDVIEVIGEPEDGAPEIRHIQNAFQLGSGYKLWW